MLIIGVVVIALYTAFTQGTLMTQMSREDQRATQILLEQTEALRMCGWEVITSSNGVPATFMVHYDPKKTNGLVYFGTMQVTNPPLAASYQTNLKQVRIRLEWQGGSLRRNREVNTLVARYGLNTYVK